mgnify:CR=1 FL=1
MSVVVEGRKLTKEERLHEWMKKALFYSKKERFTKITPKPLELYTADLGENIGSEMNGIRPFLVLTSTNYNDNSGTVTGIPCSNKEFATKGQVLITKEILKEGKVSGVIKTEMLTTISKGRLGRYIGRLNERGSVIVGDKLEYFLVPLRRKKFKKYD